MKKIRVLKAEELEIKPFVFSDFVQEKVYLKKISKKKLKNLAKEIHLDYTDEQIQFAKKLLEHYLATR